MKRRISPAFLGLVLLGYTLCSISYIDRTHFDSGDEAVYSLWDDAMISMRYARNWAQGDGLVWNVGGERVQGFSNPGVTLVMAGIHLLPIAPEKASLVVQCLALVALLGILCGCWTLARRLVPEAPIVAATTVLAVALCAPLAVWGLQGSDVAFVALWLVLCTTVVARSESASSAWPTGLLWLLAPGLLLRWDAALFYGVFVATCLLDDAPWRRRSIQAALAGTVVIGLLMGSSWLYYGDPLANTLYLKGTGTPHGLRVEEAFLQLRHWGAGSLPLLGLAGLAIWLRRRDRVIRLCGALVVAAFVYNLWAGGDWSQEFGSRFLVQVLPLLVVLGVVGLWEVVRLRMPDTAHASWRVSTLFMLGAALLVIIASPLDARREWFGRESRTMYRQQNEENYLVAQYLREHTKATTTVALHAAGVLGYFSQRTAVDVLGRSDRHIARLEVDGFEPGHSKWDWDYVVNVKRPDIILFASRGLAQRSDFRASYLQATGPNLPGRPERQRRGFFLRRSSVDKLLDDSIVLKQMRPASGSP